MLLPRRSPSGGARARGVFLLLALSASACDFSGDPLLIEPEFDDVSSFELGFEEPWTPQWMDVQTPPVTYEVAFAVEGPATLGTRSARLRLNNAAGQGKVFIQRSYEVESNQRYLVELSFDFGSADFTGAGPWRLIAGAAPESPTTWDPLESTCRHASLSIL